MATFNKVLLMGRLTDNPEPPRTLPNSGTTVVKFRLAVGRSKKNPQTGQSRLASLVAAWPTLPDAVRAALCDIVTATQRRAA